MCQQITESIQQKVRARDIIAVPVEYKNGPIPEEASPVRFQEDAVQEQSAGIQSNEAEETVVDPSLSSV
jgi:hypothetical protein